MWITAQCYILGQWLPKTAAFDAVFDMAIPRNLPRLCDVSPESSNSNN